MFEAKGITLSLLSVSLCLGGESANGDEGPSNMRHKVNRWLCILES